MGYRIGIDVGGTFTDFALYDETRQELRLGKVLTTSDDPSIGVLDGLDRLLNAAEISATDLDEASHATTIATNTVIQRRGPPTALLTTEGFRDLLIIGRQKRWELYDNAIDKPKPVIARRAVWEVRERMLYDGSVHVPLNEADVRRAAQEMSAAGVQAVAVCFLHSYVNPSHERHAATLIAEVAPKLLVSLSCDVSPVYREYERASTTTLNAYVMPAVAAYVGRLAEGLQSRGYRRQLYIMQSNGGLATPEVAKQFPIRILESGPAAGVLAAATFVEAAGTGNLLSFDMGGTTAKVCLIEDGRPMLTGQYEFDMVNLKKNSGLPISIPAIDLVEIGSGGGSLARVEMGAIAVGPESAGSSPGPICYGRGGAQPTVTDADLVLGYLDPDYFLGGRMRLDLPAARHGIETTIARELGIGVEAAAWGVYEVVTAQMAQAARVVSVGRGKDPRNFVMVPFGGAGPVHGARLARMLGCRRLVFPRGAGVASAIGLLMADPAFDLARTSVLTLGEAKLPEIETIFGGLEAQVRQQLDTSGIRGAEHTMRSCDMRFVGQGYEINVPLPDGPYRTGDLERLREAFFGAYAATYGDRAFDRADSVVGVHWRLRAVVERGPFHFASVPKGDGGGRAALKGRRPVYFPESGGFDDCPIYERHRLGADDRVQGPAIIEEVESTIVLIPGSDAVVDGHGNIVVTVGD
jgi:N-methylhydantoinase A